MSISTCPDLRGITTVAPLSSTPSASSESLRVRLDRMLGRDPATARPSTPDTCREVVDTPSTFAPVTDSAYTITGPGTRWRVVLERLRMAGARLHFDQRTRGMLAVLMLIIAAVAAAAAWYLWPRPQPLPTAVPVAHNDDESDDATEEELLVSVVGDVAEPGLVEVSAGARVADAIDAAGGLAPEVESAGYLNLARPVADGELIVVDGEDDGDAPAPEPTVPAQSRGGNDDTGGAGETPADLLNLNRATTDQLDDLPGVGPVMAERIVDYRDKNGGFDTVNQLDEVPGIGPATFEKLAKLVTV